MVTFRRQFFNRSDEFRKVVEQLKESEAKRAQIERNARKVLGEARKRIVTADTRRRRLEESVVRERKMARLLGGLSGEREKKMRTLLEATRTENLEKNYKKFLPELVQRAPAKPKTKLDEAVLEIKTGGRQTVSEMAEEADDQEIIDIRRRAGIKK